MKIRQGFVSNSSSSSFVIAKNLLTEEELAVINKAFDEFDSDDFYISQNDFYFSGGGETYAARDFVKEIDDLKLGDKVWSGGC